MSGEAELIGDVETSNAVIWNLIRERPEKPGFCDEVVHTELKKICNKIISCLVYYETEGGRKRMVDSSPAEKKDISAMSSLEKLKQKISQKLNVDVAIGWKIFTTFMTFEYKGTITSYEILMKNHKVLLEILKDLKRFYLNERICLILCSQIILLNAVDNKSPFSEIFVGFVCGASLKNWCKWLCDSLNCAINEDEKLELTHTIAIVLRYYGHHDGVVQTFMDKFKLTKQSGSDSILKAEALLNYLFFAVDDEFATQLNPLIIEYVEKNIVEIISNPFSLPALIATYSKRIKDHVVIKSFISKIPKQISRTSIKSMCQLINSYIISSHPNRRGLITLAYQAIADTMQMILTEYNREPFGTTKEWFELLTQLLKSNTISTRLIFERNEELMSLYEEAHMAFPIELKPVLSIYGAICESEDVLYDLESFSQVDYIAVNFNEIEPNSIKPIGTNEWIATAPIQLGRIEISKGTTGLNFLYDDRLTWKVYEICVPSRWEIIRDMILLPVIQIIQANNDAFIYDNLVSIRDEENVAALARFIILLDEISFYQSPDLTMLFEPLAFILKWLFSERMLVTEKEKWLKLYIGVLKSAARRDLSFVYNNIEGFWPTSVETSVVGDFILNSESVTSNEFGANLSFLTAMNVFLKLPNEGNVIMRSACFKSIYFIIDNLMPSFSRWRIHRNDVRFQILKEAIKIFRNLFQLKDAFWDTVKDYSAHALISKKSFIIEILSTDEEEIKGSLIISSKGTYKLSSVILSALRLVAILIDYDKTTIKKIDSSMGLTLVRQLGNLSRHRIDGRVSCSSMELLSKIAREIPFSLLASFGTESQSFKELISQRLEFKTEDPAIKISILEFLTICTSTQPGLIRNFFCDSYLCESLLDSLKEENGKVNIAILRFCRALFGKGTNILKKCQMNIWASMFEPITRMNSEDINMENGKYVTYLTHIISFELFNNGLADESLNAKLINMFKEEEICHIFKIIIAEPDMDEQLNAIRAFKHLLTIVFSRNEISSLFDKATQQILLELTENFFWTLRDGEKSSKADQIGGQILEIMLQLAPSQDAQFLGRVVERVAQRFGEEFIGLQLPLLILIKKCLGETKSDLSPFTIELIVKILYKVFEKGPRLFDSDCQHVRPLLSVSMSAVMGLINNEHCRGWKRIFHRYLVVQRIIGIANYGITKVIGPEVVLECLNVLIKMSLRPDTSTMISCSSIAKTLWLPISKFSGKERNDEKWLDVYAYSIHLNGCLLKTLGHYYLKQSFNFLGTHSIFLAHKLWSLSEIVENCNVNKPEVNFNEIDHLLFFNHHVLYFVAINHPYLQKWIIQQPNEARRIMEGSFATLRTSLSLLSHPNHLNILITKYKSNDPNGGKRTPQLLQVQTKLWQTITLGVHIYWNMRTEVHDFIDNGELLQALYTIVGLCVKGLTKGEKRSFPSVNAPQRLTTILEKSLSLLLFRGTLALKDPNLQGKELLSLKREIATEISALCESVKRLGLANNLFLTNLCCALEDTFK